MGWGSGSNLADDIWKYFRDYIPQVLRKKAARKLLKLFEDFDCDTLDECSQLNRDAGWREYEKGHSDH